MVDVKLSPDAQEAFERLLEQADRSKDARAVLRSLGRAFERLALDPAAGIHLQGHLVPDRYLALYGKQNLWKYDLACGWRMLYTITKDEIAIIALVYEILDHKAYERRFGY
jgi:plasmid stabilization system protein ParE